MYWFCDMFRTLTRSVTKHQLNENMQITKVKTLKSKSENYWLQLVPLPAILRPPPLSPTATQPWSSPCSVWRPFVVTTLTIGAWWNSDLLFIIKSNPLKIPHLKIAHLGGNLEVGNIDIQGYQDCPPQLCVVFLCS